MMEGGGGGEWGEGVVENKRGREWWGVIEGGGAHLALHCSCLWAVVLVCAHSFLFTGSHIRSWAVAFVCAHLRLFMGSRVCLWVQLHLFLSVCVHSGQSCHWQGVVVVGHW